MIPPSPAVVKLISKGLKRGDADGEQARLGLLIFLSANCPLTACCSPLSSRRKPSAPLSVPLFFKSLSRNSCSSIRRSSAVHDEMRNYSLFVALVTVVYLAQEYLFADAYILASNEETPLSVLVDTLWWQNHMGRGMDRLLKLGRDSGLSLDIQNDVRSPSLARTTLLKPWRNFWPAAQTQTLLKMMVGRPYTLQLSMETRPRWKYCLNTMPTQPFSIERGSCRLNWLWTRGTPQKPMFLRGERMTLLPMPTTSAE